MSRRELEGKGSLEGGNVCNVVQLQSAGRTTAARETRVLGPAPDAVTRDGLDLLKAFFAIEDAATRAALILLAQRLAGQSPKR